MEKQWFVAPSPRTSRTVYTIAGSILLHGSVIAVAALWTVRGAPSSPPPLMTDPPLVTNIDPGLPVNVVQLPPSSPEVSKPDTPDDTPEPVLTADHFTNTPPPSEEPPMTDPAPPKPPSKTVVGKTRTMRPATTGQPGAANTGTRSAVGMVNGTGRPGAVARWSTPQPPYPYALRAGRVQGNGSVRITTDGSGHVVGVSVVQSTGNAMLDTNTSQFARANWSGPPNASVTVPITYQMR